MGLGGRLAVAAGFVYGIATLYFISNLYSSSSSSNSICREGGVRDGDPLNFRINYSDDQLQQLKLLLEKTATPNKTVILTSINNAWATPGSIFDLFLESLRTGNNTQRHLQHLLVVSFDDRAYARCLVVHSHCYHLQGFNFTNEAYFMSRNYIEIVWRKVKFLGNVLSLGYNFLFTDCDIMWLRDPFPYLLSSNANLQVACDHYNGNHTSMKNEPNTGFMYVTSDIHTIMFYKLWYMSHITQQPKMHDQDAFNFIMTSSNNLFNILGLRVRFLSTTRFSGFCQLSTDFDKICTMHANCCTGLDSKVHDLRLVLSDWRNYSDNIKVSSAGSLAMKWSVPNHCRVLIRDHFNTTDTN